MVAKAERERVQRARRHVDASLSVGRARKSHCKWGHPLADDNLYISKDGKRTCRLCRLAISRRAWKRSHPTRNPYPRTLCPSRHRMTKANTYVGPDAVRRCRRCRKDVSLAQAQSDTRKRRQSKVVAAYTTLIVELHEAGQTINEIALFTASTPMAVSQTLVQAGVKIGTTH